MATLPYGLDDRRDGVVGLSFAMRQVAQLLLMCDRQDIGISIGGGDETDGKMGTGVIFGGHSKPSSLVSSIDDPRPRVPDGPLVVSYEKYPGGCGFSAR